MSKTEEKTTELMKKAKDFIPDGGYSEKELNFAFFMFIKGYRQAEKDNELTWEDIDWIVGEAMCRVPDDWTTEQICKEVLKQFNAAKGKG